jgi:hypothetical protein
MLALGGTLLHGTRRWRRVGHIGRDDLMIVFESTMFGTSSLACPPSVPTHITFFFSAPTNVRPGFFPRLVSCESLISAGRLRGATIGRASGGQICILSHTLFPRSTLGTALSLAPQGQSVIPQSSSKELQRGMARQTSAMDPMPLQWPVLIKLVSSSTNSSLYTH